MAKNTKAAPEVEVKMSGAERDYLDLKAQCELSAKKNRGKADSDLMDKKAAAFQKLRAEQRYNAKVKAGLIKPQK